MPQDIYGVTSEYKSTGILKAHDMKMTLENSSGFENTALVQNVSIQYTQPVQIIREVGSRKFYYFSQPASGQVSFSRLVSEDANILKMIPKSAWEAPTIDGNPNNPSITLSNKNNTWVLHKCLVSNFGTSVNADAAYVQEQVTMTFLGLEIK